MTDTKTRHTPGLMLACKCPACGKYTRAGEPIDETGSQFRECSCGWSADVELMDPKDARSLLAKVRP